MNKEKIEITDKKFAKLFEVNGKQLLVYCTFEDDEFKLNQILRANLGEVNIAIGFKKEESLDRIFNSYDQARAELALEKIEKSLQEVF